MPDNQFPTLPEGFAPKDEFPDLPEGLSGGDFPALPDELRPKEEGFAFSDRSLVSDIMRPYAYAVNEFARHFYGRLEGAARRNVEDMTDDPTAPSAIGDLMNYFKESIPRTAAPRGWMEKFPSAVTQAGLTVAEIMALSRVTGSPTVAMATLGGIEGYGAEGGFGLAKGAASGAVLGQVFKATSYMPKLMAVPTTGLVFGGMTAQGLVSERGGIEYLTEEDRQDILIDTLVGVLLAAPGRNPSFAAFRETYRKRGFSPQEIAAAEAKFEEVAGPRKGIEELLEFSAAQRAAAQAKQLGLPGIIRPSGMREPALVVDPAQKAPIKERGQLRLPLYRKTGKTKGEAARDVVARTERALTAAKAQPEKRTEIVNKANVELDDIRGFKIEKNLITQEPTTPIARFETPESVPEAFFAPRVKDRRVTKRVPKEAEKFVDERVGERRSDKLTPALELKGKVYTKEGAVTHGDLLDEVPYELYGGEISWINTGWVDSKGRFLTGEEALGRVSPEVKLASKVLGSHGLASEDFALAAKDKEMIAKTQFGDSFSNLYKEEKADVLGIIDYYGKELKGKQVKKGISPVEARLREERAEVPDFRQPFIEPRLSALESIEGEKRSTESIETDLVSQEGKIAGVKKRMASETEEAAVMNSRVELDLLEKTEAKLIKELQSSRMDEIKKADPDTQFIDPKPPFEDTTDRGLLTDTRIGPDTVEKAGKLDAQEKAFQDIRKDSTAAYRTKSGRIITGRTHGELTGEIINLPSEEAVGVEMGWLYKDGSFLPEGMLRKGPITDTKVTEKMTMSRLSKILSKLNEERGSFSSDPLPAELTTEQLREVRELQSSFKQIRRAAKKEKKDVYTYMRDIGLSDNAIETYQRVTLIDIQTSEVIPYATNAQKAQAHKLAEEVGVDLEKVKDSIGLTGRSMKGKGFTYDEAKSLIDTLKRIETSKTGEQESLEVLQDRLLSDKPGSSGELVVRDGEVVAGIKRASQKASEYVNSPEVFARRHPISEEMYLTTDRADMSKKRHTEYIMSERGLGVDAIEHVIEKNPEGARKVALAQEGKLGVEKLTADEVLALKTLRTTYKHMLDSYVDRVIPDPNRRQIIQTIAKKYRWNEVENGERVQAVLADLKKEYKLTAPEMEALEVMRNERKYYLPHVHDKQALIEHVRMKLSKMEAAKNKNRAAISSYKDTLVNLEGGQLVTFNQVPKSIMRGFFEERHGLKGYKVDAGIAFNSYIKWWLKKMYDEPALRKFAELYPQLPPELKPYWQQYMINYMGLGPREPISNFLKQAEWIRTLGLSGRSATTNLTQMINTFAEAGYTADALAGLSRAWTRDGIRQFRDSGLPREIPTVIYSGETEIASNLEKFRVFSGILFNAAEFANRNHAYHTGLVKAEKAGLSGDSAYWYAVDFVHKTQFRYGRVGMPRMTRGGMGVFTQFSSFPIKQTELMYSWTQGRDIITKEALDKRPKDVVLTAKKRSDGLYEVKDKKMGWSKLFLYTALSYGAIEGSKRIGFDISNALGVGVSPGEIMKSLEAMSQQEWEESERHWRQAWMSGGGILPQGVFPLTGPFLQLVTTIQGRSQDNMYKIMAELEPLQARRFRDMYYAFKHQKDGKFPVFKYDTPDILTGRPVKKKYELDLKQTLTRALGPKPSAETEKQIAELRHKLIDSEIKDILMKFDRALMRGKSKEINRIFEKYPGIVYGRDIKKTVEQDILNLHLTDAERRLLQDSKGGAPLRRRLELEAIP